MCTTDGAYLKLDYNSSFLQEICIIELCTFSLLSVTKIGLLIPPSISQRSNLHTNGIFITGTEEELHLSLVLSILGHHNCH